MGECRDETDLTLIRRANAPRIPEVTLMERFVVNAYDEAGYGDQLFSSRDEAITYAQSLEKRFGATVWRRIVVSQIPDEKVWPLPEPTPREIVESHMANAPPDVRAAWEQHEREKKNAT